MLTSAQAATLVWANTTGTWDVPANWVGAAPSGMDPTDVLVFGGDVSTPYTSRNNLNSFPSLVNQLVLSAPNSANSTNSHVITGLPIALTGAAPQVVQNNAGGFTLNLAVQLRASLTLAGNGSGPVTFLQPIDGAFDITKTGTSTFRFGAALFQPSSNRWLGRMIINEGGIRFADGISGIAALRGNPVTLNSPTSTLAHTAGLRIGTLSGDSGLVESRVIGTNASSEDIVIHALSDGTYGGTLRLGPATGSGRDIGRLVIRGVGKQTLSGMFVSADSPAGANALQIQKDVSIGHGATLSLVGNASLAQQSEGGAIVMGGGTFQLDNRAANNPNRLRDGDSGSTGLDSAGGGLFELIGHTSGTNELMPRLQLGSPSNARSGALTVRVTHSAGTTASTQLLIQSLSRDGFAPTFSTIDFGAADAAGAELPLGEAAAGPRISFVIPPPLANGLLRNTRNFNEATVGWATVNGSAFATHGANGIGPVALSAAPAGDTVGDPVANTDVRGNFVAAHADGYAVNSLRLEPSADGQSFSLNTPGHLKTAAILLAGSRDYTISATSQGGLAGPATGGSTAAAGRYIHVETATLTIGARLDVTSIPLVKAGQGTLVLTNTSNFNAVSPTVLNAGVLRASPASTLPMGELRFRGGVLEITGGGTFSRNVGAGQGFVNWAGFNELGDEMDEDQGSGGFAAIGADASIDLYEPGPTVIEWEGRGFIDNGHALLFGSQTADRRITWLDSLHLGGRDSDEIVQRYNAREIRVIDNSASSTDVTRFTAGIGGSVQNDLLKTGAGTLELIGTSSYRGATLVHEGTLFINSPGTIGASFLTEIRNGATLGGNGTVGAVKVAAGGRLAPGNNEFVTAVLSTGDLTFESAGAQLSIDLRDGAPGSGFDQLAVTGTVTLNGANLTGSLLTGFQPTINDLFFVILNDGVDAVTDTFVQGNLILIDGAPFEINYTGNAQAATVTGGNDVVLRFIPEHATGMLLLAGVGYFIFPRRRRGT